MKHIVIVGAGFAGLETAKKLSGLDVLITVIDKSNHHLFQPLLYQVATAALSPADIAAPIRHIFRKQKNIRILMAEVLRIDADKKSLVHTSGEIKFDYLVLATGVENNYFGNKNWEEYSLGLKDLAEATEIRRRILLAFEEAEKANEEDRKSWMTFIIIGGGPTGVEMSGAIAELAKVTLSDNFRSTDPKLANILLIEGGPRLLSTYPEDLSEKTKIQLEALGVTVKLNSKVEDIKESGAQISGHFFPSKTVIWCAGVKAPSLLKTLGSELDRNGRAIVQSDLTIKGHSHIFVIGDSASYTDHGKLVPGVCPAAMQMGWYVAKSIKADLNQQPRGAFQYFDKGSMAIIGKKKAVADLTKLSRQSWMKFSGLPAWFAWLFVHILFLVGFRNRFIVIIQWGFAYFTAQRHSRLIVGRFLPKSQNR
jgi:NADH dehydrogenase